MASKPDSTELQSLSPPTATDPEDSSPDVTPSSVPSSATSDDSNASIRAIADVKTDSDANPSTKLLQNFMQAAQRGDIDSLAHALDSEQIKVNDTLDDNVTALHWAALNNNLAAVKMLVKRGATVDYVGGDLKSTPLQWACRYGLVYVVDYLIRECHADFHVSDAQGFNCLHLAVHSSNIMMVIYITRFTDIDINLKDPKGRSPLHWACYQGDHLTVEYLLTLHPSVNSADSTGMTPLHWAIVRQSHDIITALIKAGADLHAMSGAKGCWQIAREMNCTKTFHTALYECGYTNKFECVHPHISEPVAKIITFTIPLVVLVLSLLAFAHWLFVGALVASCVLYALQALLLTKVIVPTYMRERNAMIKTPYFCGVFVSTVVLVVFTWLYTILRPTFIAHSFLHFILLLLATATLSSFVKACRLDPGAIPADTDEENIRKTISTLLKLRQYDADHFCIYTMIRKPLRSKYSKARRLNVACFDHFCPWIYNDVGLRNHKLFMAFALSLSIAICIYLGLAVSYFGKLPTVDEETASSAVCQLIGSTLCTGLHRSSFLFYLCIWTSMQQVWLVILLFVQTFTISWGYTTYEFTNRYSTKSMSFSSIPREEQQANNGSDAGMANNGQDNNQESTQAAADSISHNTTSGPRFISILLALPSIIFNSRLCRILGINQVTQISSQILHRTRRVGSRYNYGIKQNWLDFLFVRRPGENYRLANLCRIAKDGEANLGGEYVDYYHLYTQPPNPGYMPV